MSLTPANTCFAQIHALPVSLTPANECFAGVNDTGEEFFSSGVVDTGEALKNSKSVTYRCCLHRRSTEIIEYLREYSKKIEIVTRLVYWGQEKLFEEKTRGENLVALSL